MITKIVDYELSPGGATAPAQEYEGVWHVEGMSHENIVATALYVLDRDPALVGAELLFKRALSRPEAMCIFSAVPQDRPHVAERIIADGLLPLGRVATPAGRLVCFPNSHVHRVRA